MPKKKVEIELDGAKKVIEVPEPLKRKCEIKQVLPPGVLQLLASAPHNETIRSVLLAHLKVPVPEELKTFKDIQDWIEFNIDPPKVPLSKASPVPGRSEELIQVMVIANEREHGRCRYSQDTRGQGTIPLTREEILELATNSDDASEFFDEVRQLMYDAGVRDHISMDVVGGSEDYSDHDCDDGDGVTVDLHVDGQNMLKRFIQERDPENYERLFE